MTLSGHHDFDLGNLWAMVFAMSTAKEFPRLCLYRDGSHIQSHDLGGEFINGKCVLIAFLLDFLPRVLVAEGLEEVGEPIIGKIGVFDLVW